jgi:predicted amidohydrolase
MVSLKWPLLSYSVILVILLTFSLCRLRETGDNNNVKMAEIIYNGNIGNPLREEIKRHLAGYADNTLPADTMKQINQVAQMNNEYLFDLTRQAAANGAKLICWGEGNCILLAGKEQETLNTGSRLANQYQIYLALALNVYYPRKNYPFENKIVMIGPKGEILGQYLKFHPIGSEEQLIRKGSGVPPIYSTPYGKMMDMICFDTDFTNYARQSGKKGADILIAPSDDWESIAVIRGDITRFRPLENGVTLIRPTSNGVSEVIDSKGRLLQCNNYFKSPNHLLYADIPVNGGVRTFYSKYGDWFVYVILLIGIFLVFQLISCRSINKWLVVAFSTVLFSCISCISFAQETTLSPQKVPADSVRGKRNILLPAFSYAPETSVALGTLYLHFFKTDSSSRISQNMLTALYTFKNQFILFDNLLGYMDQNKYLFNINSVFTKYPEYFYGIGSHTPSGAKQTVTYNEVHLDGSFDRQLLRNFYAGLKINYYNYYNIQYNKANNLVNEQYGIHGGQTVGVGFNMIYDTRDNVFSAAEGWYFSTSGMWNDKSLGGVYNYKTLDVDIRKFFRLTPTSVLAMQGVGMLKDGNVPFLQLSYLGGSTIMRGFYNGRYRDNDLLSAQVEYRKALSKKFGFVVFAGEGEVYNQFDKATISDFKTSYGFGLRKTLDVAQRLNLRMDLGFGNGSANFYVNIAEAF